MATSKRRVTKPAIKKASTRKKKKRKSSSHLMATVWKTLLLVFIVVIAFIFLLYLFDYMYPQKPSKKTKTEQVEKISETKERTAFKPTPAEMQTSLPNESSHTLTFPPHAERPRIQAKRKERIVHYQAYTVSFNSEYKIANWVTWELTDSEAVSTENDRSNTFTPDQQLRGLTADAEDYRRSGYDRGHLIPAADVKWSAQAMRESFYFSNICPQAPRLNRGIWKDLEEQCRLWAKDHGALLIAAGPVIESDLPRLGNNKVAIPRYFFKVISTISDNQYQGIAFLMENRDYDSITLRQMAIPIDSVEKVTGIDFFPDLPDELENEMEATIHWPCWSF